MFRVLVFLAVWKRPKITELCFKGIERLRNYKPSRFRVDALAVISEPSMRPLCEKYGIDYIEFPNDPVGKKKNAGLTEAFTRKWDYLLEIGSDNLLRNEALDCFEPFMEQGAPLFSFNSLVFADSLTGEGVYYKTNGAFGAGRCMSRAMLELVTERIEVEAKDSIITNGVAIPSGARDFINVETARELERAGYVEIVGDPTHYLWGQNLNMSLDNSSNYLLHKNGFDAVAITPHEPLVIDIKSEENIWPYNPAIGVKYDPMNFLKHCSKEERETFIDLLLVEA